MAKKIILDCDPGHDDAVAILLALGNPEIEIVGITTVGGNQSLEKVTYNARAMLEAAHAHDIPVYAGSDRPLEDMHAVNFIVKTIMESEPGTITLVPTGPLTNIALALRMEPRIAERVSEVVLMGGGFHEGNWSAVAEFNIIVDPEAAHIVFNAPWKLTMVGLDLTHQALCTPEVQRRIEEIGTPLAVIVSGLMDFFRKTYQDNQDFVDPPVHDPCTVAYLIDPSVVQTRRCPLDVELHGELTLGMTVADLRGPEPSEEECHTQVATKLDFDKFWNLVIQAIENIG